MNIQFNPTAATQHQTNSFTPAAVTTALQGKSSISGSSSESSFFSTVLDAITFIPRKLYALLQMLFCCGGQSLADRIASDPKAAAKQEFEKFENAKVLETASESWAKDFESVAAKDIEWMKDNALKLMTYMGELCKLCNESKNPELQKMGQELKDLILLKMSGK